jgi:hypothetical protein
MQENIDENQKKGESEETSFPMTRKKLFEEKMRKKMIRQLECILGRRYIQKHA